MKKWRLMVVVLVVGLAAMMVLGYLTMELIYSHRLRISTLESEYQDYVKPGIFAVGTATATVAVATPPAKISELEVEETSPKLVVYSDQERSIAYKADIDLKVGKGRVRDTVDKVLLATKMYGGYLTSMDVGEKDAYLTVKIQQENFFIFTEEISRFGEVYKKSVSGMDVTDKILDLKARIRNAEALEASLLKLLEKAEKVSDMLEVMRELSRVREEIEIMKAQLENLERSVAYSAVSLWIEEKLEEEYVKIFFRVLDSRNSPVQNTHIYIKGDETSRLITDEFGEAEATFKKDQNITLMATFYRSDGEILKATLHEVLDSNKTITVKFDKPSVPPAVNLDKISDAIATLIQYLVLGLIVLVILVAPILFIIVVLAATIQRIYRKVKSKQLI